MKSNEIPELNLYYLIEILKRNGGAQGAASYFEITVEQFEKILACYKTVKHKSINAKWLINKTDFSGLEKKLGIQLIQPLDQICKGKVDIEIVNKITKKYTEALQKFPMVSLADIHKKFLTSSFEKEVSFNDEMRKKIQTEFGISFNTLNAISENIRFNNKQNLAGIETEYDFMRWLINNDESMVIKTLGEKVYYSPFKSSDFRIQESSMEKLTNALKRKNNSSTNDTATQKKEARPTKKPKKSSSSTEKNNNTSFGFFDPRSRQVPNENNQPTNNNLSQIALTDKGFIEYFGLPVQNPTNSAPSSISQTQTINNFFDHRENQMASCSIDSVEYLELINPEDNTPF